MRLIAHTPAQATSRYRRRNEYHVSPSSLAIEAEPCVLQRATGGDVHRENLPRDNRLDLRLGEHPVRKRGHELVAIAAPPMLRRKAIPDLDRPILVDTTDGATVTNHHSVEGDEPNE